MLPWELKSFNIRLLLPLDTLHVDCYNNEDLYISVSVFSEGCEDVTSKYHYYDYYLFSCTCLNLE